MSKIFRSPLFLMAFTIFIDFTGFGLIIPLLPFWAQHLRANAVGVGLILTIYALAQFIFTPILGSLSDRYGRRPVIITSLVIEAIALALTALANTLPLLFIARFIGGVGSSNIGSAQAVVSDVTPPTGRARGMGLIGAAIGMGFVVGPAIGGVLAPLGPAVPFWAAMGVAIVNTLLVALFLPETRKRGVTAAQTHKGEGVSVLLAGWQQALRHPVVARLAIINLLFNVAFTAMEAIYPLFSQHVFGWTAMQNGYIFTYVGIIVVIMQGGLVGKLVKRFGERNLLIAGLIMLAIGLGLLPWSTQLGLMLVALGILSAGDGAVTPTISTLLSFASSEHTQGETLGFAQGLAGLGRIVGPLIAGSFYAFAGPGSPFLMGAGLVIVALLIALSTLPVSKRTEEQPVPHAGEAVKEVSSAAKKN
ncbi:MAG TPA: MFS transporter [Ktedonobacteraceae bacterium]|nr:MFS transporter [Ktedonobacteraceae bacterium]